MYFNEVRFKSKNKKHSTPFVRQINILQTEEVMRVNHIIRYLVTLSVYPWGLYELCMIQNLFLKSFLFLKAEFCGL